MFLVAKLGIFFLCFEVSLKKDATGENVFRNNRLPLLSNSPIPLGFYKKRAAIPLYFHGKLVVIPLDFYENEAFYVESPQYPLSLC